MGTICSDFRGFFMSSSGTNLAVLLHALTPIVPGDSGTITSAIF